jgi:hypothetical protein
MVKQSLAVWIKMDSIPQCINSKSKALLSSTPSTTKKKKRLKEKKVKINYKSIKELEKVFLLEREDVPKCNKKIQNT